MASDIDSLFSAGGTSALRSKVSGLDDFELICFLVVQHEDAMLSFPATTEFNRRIPKQKFYENLPVSPATKRVFVEQIRSVIWRNKIAASTTNLAQGEAVTELEVFEVQLNQQGLEEIVLRLMDQAIP